MVTTTLRRSFQAILALGAVIALLAIGALAPAQAHRELASVLQAPSGGTLNYRDSGTPTCLDPLLAPTRIEGVIDYATFDNLVLLDGKGLPRPDLATSWKISHGGRWITFKLRKGVQFSNGDPFDANVVKFNMNRELGPVGASAGMSALLGPLHKARVDNKYQVTLILNSPFRPLLRNLANDSSGIVDPIALRKEGKNKFCEYPVGTGPYKIQNYGPGGNPVTLVRNPYRNFDWPWAFNRGKPYLNKIVVKPILSDSTAASELLSGGVNLGLISGDQVSRFQNNSSIAVHKILAQVQTQLVFNAAKAPFNNAQVRYAVGEAIDRSGLIKVGLSGFGRPAYSPIPPTVQFSNPASKNLAPPFNPTAAKKVFAAHHMTRTYLLITRNEPEFRADGEYIQAALANAGLKVSVRSEPPPDWISASQKGQFDMTLQNFYFPDPDIMYFNFDSTQEQGGGLNFTHYVNSTLDHLVSAGRSTNNTVQARNDYYKAQRFVLKQALIDPLYTPYYIYVDQSNLKGLHTDSTALFPVFQDLYYKK